MQDLGMRMGFCLEEKTRNLGAADLIKSPPPVVECKWCLVVSIVTCDNWMGWSQREETGWVPDSPWAVLRRVLKVKYDTTGLHNKFEWWRVWSCAYSSKCCHFQFKDAVTEVCFHLENKQTKEIKDNSSHIPACWLDLVTLKEEEGKRNWELYGEKHINHLVKWASLAWWCGDCRPLRCDGKDMFEYSFPKPITQNKHKRNGHWENHQPKVLLISLIS